MSKTISSTVTFVIMTAVLAEAHKLIGKNTSALAAKEFGSEPSVSGENSPNGTNGVAVHLDRIKATDDAAKLAPKFRNVGVSFLETSAKMERRNQVIARKSEGFTALEQSAIGVKKMLSEKPDYASAFAPAQECYAEISAKIQNGEEITREDVRSYWTALGLGYTVAAQLIERTIARN